MVRAAQRIYLTKKAAYAAGEDAANRNMRAHGRKAWSHEDWNIGAKVTNDLLAKLATETEKK